jgi:hypothetical protein
MRFKDFNIITEAPEPDIIRALRDFLPIAVKELKLKRLPKIKFLSKLDNEDQPTFGRFSHDGKKAMIELNIFNRHPVDVLRTLAHEMVHYKQFVHKQLGKNSGDTGSSSENEAHVIAGIIMRHFDKGYPEYLSSKNISDESTVKFNENKTSPYTASMSIERAIQYLKDFCKTTTGFTLDYNYSHFTRRLIDPRNESTITGFDLKRTLKEFLKVWRNDLPALKVNTQFVIHDPSTSLWIPVFIGVENKELILKTIMKGRHYDTTDEVVTITHDDVVSESTSKDKKLAQALEDYANKHIPEREPGFGDFMYHAELLRKGHKDIHKQDLNTVQKKYLTIMKDMIKKHLNENMDHKKDDQAVAELKAALLSHKSKLQSKSDDAVYKTIDQMMTRVAKAHGLTGQKLHDMWVDKYKEIPDTWIMTETRQAAWTWLKKKLPKWPDYVLRDWVYNLLKGDFPRDLDRGSDPSANIDEMLRSEGLSADTVWKLVPDFQFSLDTLNPWTVDKIKRRWGGASDAGIGVPNDAARHATQKAIIQKQGGIRKEPVIIVKKPDGYELVEGWHRTIQHFAMYPDGYKGPAWVAVAKSNRGVAEAIAPHGSPEDEFKYMQSGNKPAALVDPVYFKKLYKKTADANHWPYFQLSIPGQKYSNFVVGLPGQEKRIHRIAELVTDMNVNMQQGIKPGAAYHRELGTLLGYNESDIQDFLKKMNLDEEYRDADYARGNVKMPAANPGRRNHPLHGKLVGE